VSTGSQQATKRNDWSSLSEIPLSDVETKILTLDVGLAGTVGEIARPNYALHYRILQREKQHDRLDHLNTLFGSPHWLRKEQTEQKAAA
jgi:hypothetical protein